MTAPESHDNHVVEEEQRIIDQALDALIDIHRAEAAGGIHRRLWRGLSLPPHHPESPRSNRAQSMG